MRSSEGLGPNTKAHFWGGQWAVRLTNSHSPLCWDEV